MTDFLLHLTEPALWAAAQHDGTYTWSTRGRTLQQEGFIHLSHPHQLPAVARMLYGSEEVELIVLVIDPARLTAPLRHEAMSEGGEEFPHLYGPLPVDAVVEVRTWTRAGGGGAAG
ncbi:DUF952 domain-containing protein [Streptomyces sp. NBC_01335]|uniref:DUF952 domain-containing protein n=1 Tax=Streptomyces sp. NBC_01335 TaxID=2903828 RepID=UPI002E12B635|nr:DUF952 domain-containing protein [Streptomyces sp. NBC_01335]